MSATVELTRPIFRQQRSQQRPSVSIETRPLWTSCRPGRLRGAAKLLLREFLMSPTRVPKTPTIRFG